MRKNGVAEAMECRMAELVAAAKIRSHMTQEQISEAIGYNDKYLARLKTKRRLKDLPFSKVSVLAALSGREIVIGEANHD